MTVPYAEVIGDPVSHSKSPLIHRFWLEKLGIEADYRAQQVTAAELADYLASRRVDPAWRGCNITAPLKELAAAFVAAPDPCRHLGAVNCIVPKPPSNLLGVNTDISGVAEALRDARFEQALICLIGSGGVARSVLFHLQKRPILAVRILARDKKKARRLWEQFNCPIEIYDFGDTPAAMTGSSLIINATPLGMTGGHPMVPDVIDWLSHVDPGATIFDTVYTPLETELLSHSKRIGLRTVDGLSMLIGQAAPAFELFFGQRAPREHDVELTTLLTS